MRITRGTFLKGSAAVAALGGLAYAGYEWWNTPITMHSSSEFANDDEKAAISNGRDAVLSLAKDRWGYNYTPGQIIWGVDTQDQITQQGTTPYEPNLARTFVSQNKIWTFFNRSCFNGSSEQAIGLDFLPYLAAYQTTHAVALCSPERPLLTQAFNTIAENSIALYSAQGLNLTFANKTEKGVFPIVRNELTAALATTVAFIYDGKKVDISGIAPGLHNLRRFIEDCQVMHESSLNVLGRCLVQSDIESAIKELCGIDHDENISEVKDHLFVSLIGALIEAGSAPNEDLYQTAIAKFNITCRAIKEYLRTKKATDINEMTSQLSEYNILIRGY